MAITFRLGFLRTVTQCAFSAPHFVTKSTVAVKREEPGIFSQLHPDSEARAKRVKSWIDANFGPPDAELVADDWHLEFLNRNYLMLMEDQIDTNRFGRTQSLLERHAAIGVRPAGRIRRSRHRTIVVVGQRFSQRLADRVPWPFPADAWTGALFLRLLPLHECGRLPNSLSWLLLIDSARMREGSEPVHAMIAAHPALVDTAER